MICDKEDTAAILSLTTGVTGFVIGLLLGSIEDENTIPNTEKVESGYVVPSELEVKVKDLNGNGENEVIMRYNNKDYLLTLDDQGKPRVQSYEIKPTIEYQKRE